jgi:hypothetical protein
MCECVIECERTEIENKNHPETKKEAVTNMIFEKERKKYK